MKRESKTVLGLAAKKQPVAGALTKPVHQGKDGGEKLAEEEEENETVVVGEKGKDKTSKGKNIQGKAVEAVEAEDSHDGEDGASKGGSMTFMEQILALRAWQSEFKATPPATGRTWMEYEVLAKEGKLSGIETDYFSELDTRLQWEVHCILATCTTVESFTHGFYEAGHAFTSLHFKCPEGDEEEELDKIEELFRVSLIPIKETWFRHGEIRVSTKPELGVGIPSPPKTDIVEKMLQSIVMNR